MFVSSQVVFVVLIHGFIALAENTNTTRKALDDYNETSTTEVTPEQTFTPTAISVTTTVNSSTISASTPTPTFRDEATTSETSTEKLTTTGQITVSKTTKNEDVANQEISTSLAAAKTATTSLSTESPCPDGGCSTSSESLKLTTGHFDQISSAEETGGQQTQSEHSSTDSTSSESPSTQTQNKVPGSGDATTANESGSTTGEALGTSVSSTKEVLADYQKDSIDSLLIPSTHLHVLGVLVGVLGAVVILFFIMIIYRRVKDSGKKKMCFNKESKRLDMLSLRRFTINDVRASFGGIPANGDIWHEMSKDSSIVV